MEMTLMISTFPVCAMNTTSPHNSPAVENIVEAIIGAGEGVSGKHDLGIGQVKLMLFQIEPPLFRGEDEVREPDSIDNYLYFQALDDKPVTSFQSVRFYGF
ncbi:MAG: hypothetical protein LBU43_02315 [Candidatus Accumulibacter sp.]|jgi:hypothetical protein|nr:hypothetical protein [Accumulibacter sp.]